MPKYLRIAVSALSLTACVLMIALWVRSYSWLDLFGGSLPISDLRGLMVASLNGHMRIVLGEVQQTNFSWGVESIAAEFAGRKGASMVETNALGFRYV